LEEGEGEKNTFLGREKGRKEGRRQGRNGMVEGTGGERKDETVNTIKNIIHSF
jgi:hypothetical protein